MSTTKTIQQVIVRDGGRCVIAGLFCTHTATVADHRANRGSGGSKVLNNPACLIASCVRCNGWKEDVVGIHRLELEERGIRVLKAATNAETLTRCIATPVEYPDGALYSLTPDGGRVLVGTNHTT